MKDWLSKYVENSQKHFSTDSIQALTSLWGHRSSEGCAIVGISRFTRPITLDLMSSPFFFLFFHQYLIFIINYVSAAWVLSRCANAHNSLGTGQGELMHTTSWEQVVESYLTMSAFHIIWFFQLIGTYT